MPLPPDAFTIAGGCNCGAIRYKVAIASLKERPLHPHPTSEDKVHLPFVCIDHCNDCRRANGAVLGMVICAPIDMITSSLVVRSKASLSAEPSMRKPGDASREERGPWVPAETQFVSDVALANNDSFLTFFDSSVGRRRWFCSRCGTNVAYLAFPMPDGWPVNMLDIFLGTVDRADLEDEVLSPERQLWWGRGIKWVQELSSGGVGSLPKHPSSKVDEIVQEI
jgi:hypothetical protein